MAGSCWAGMVAPSPARLYYPAMEAVVARSQYSPPAPMRVRMLHMSARIGATRIGHAVHISSYHTGVPSDRRPALLQQLDHIQWCIHCVEAEFL